jgi:hypothetical protein
MERQRTGCVKRIRRAELRIGGRSSGAENAQCNGNERNERKRALQMNPPFVLVWIRTENRALIVSEIPRLAPEPTAGARRTAQENEP